MDSQAALTEVRPARATVKEVNFMIVEVFVTIDNWFE